jgi:cytochrome c-type protein NapB
MKVAVCLLAVIAYASFFSSPVQAEAQEDYESDARYAEAQPPTIPHPFRDAADGKYCLRCHGTGLNGAPLSPHPVRITCTECHVKGEITLHSPAKK